MIRNWLVNSRNHPVLLVKYEELKQNTLQEVLRMLNFLMVPYSKDMVEQRLAAGFNSFQRSHHKNDFDRRKLQMYVCLILKSTGSVA